MISDLFASYVLALSKLKQIQLLSIESNKVYQAPITKVPNIISSFCCRNRSQELVITGVGKSWEGWFTCKAHNSYGSISADAYVTVIGNYIR